MLGFFGLNKINSKTIQYGMLLGFLLFLVFTFITYGLKTTTTTNAGFLVSLTVVFIPILSTILLKKKVEYKLITSILVAIIGIALLTIKLPFKIHMGDLLCISAALAYAFHITVADYASKQVDLGIMQLVLLLFTA